jgi:hypothetical protein
MLEAYDSAANGEPSRDRRHSHLIPEGHRDVLAAGGTGPTRWNAAVLGDGDLFLAPALWRAIATISSGA